MDDTGLLQTFWKPATPLWAIFLVVVVTAIRMSPQWMERWLAFLQARADRKSQDWTRLQSEVTRLADRVETLEHKVEQCERERSMWMGRAIAAEAALMGKGQAAQEASRIVAEERADPAKAPSARKRFGDGRKK